MANESTEIHLVRRPNGWPVAEDFATVKTNLPDPGSGELLVRNKFISIDPYMRGRMNDVPSYVPPYELNKVMEGGAVGVVEASGTDTFQPGQYVLHNDGWRDLALVDAGTVRVVDPAQAPSLSSYLGVLGMTGLTAYVGLLDIAEFKPGDTVFVSGAAGAVGQIVGQIARLKGAKRVVGSAGSDAKVDYLTRQLGFDAAFNYRDAPVAEQLRAAAPEGIDVYFDNVGGDHLEAAIGSMNPGGRIAVCGAIAQYNDTSPTPGPANLASFIGKRLSMRGFIVLDHYSRAPEFIADMSDWLSGGKITAEETVSEGIDSAVPAFLGMLGGSNLGKAIVRV